jgi:predicted anti-sigma-YlaC factor YlaD
MVLWWKTTKCDRAAEWISLELDGELSELDRARLEDHLDRCPSCRAWQAEVAGFTGLMRSAPPAELSAPVAIVLPRLRARRRAAAATLATAAAAVAAAIVALPQTAQNVSSGALPFEDAQQQRQFAQEHVRTELAAFLVAPDAPPQSFASRALL